MLAVLGGSPPGARASSEIPDAGPSPALPSVPVDQLWGARVAEISMQLPPGLDRETAEQLLGIKPGDTLDASAVRRGVKRLVLLAKMDDVRMWAVPLQEGPDSVRLVVQLIASRVIKEIRYTGLMDTPVANIRRDVLVNEGDALDEHTLDAVHRQVKNALAQEGYPRAEVDVAVQSVGTDGTSVALVVEVRRDQPLKTSRIVIEGDLRFPEWQLRDQVSLGKGGLASRARLESAARHLEEWLRAKGHYTARVQPAPIQPDPDGRTAPLILRVRAGPRWVVTFRGNHVLPSRLLTEKLDLPPDRPLDRDLAAALEDKLLTAYRNAGYHHAKVKAHAAPGTEKGTRRLIFLIKEGPFTTLRSVKLEGVKSLPRMQLEDEALLAAAEDLPSESPINQRIDRRDVDAALSSGDSEREFYPQGRDPYVHKGTEWPHSITGLLDREEVYDERRFEKGARAVEDVYKSRGFLSPRVQGPIANYALDGALVDVRYKVTEGVQTRISSISFRNNVSIPADELLEVVRQATDGATRLEPGAPLNLFAVEEARLALMKHYADHGYPLAEVLDDVQFENARREANLAYQVTEGERVHVGAVEITGNEVTQRVVVRAQLALGPGDLYRRKDIEESRRKLLNLGFFSSVDIALKEDETGPVRTLVVTVRERSFGDGEVGAGMSLEQGPRGFLGLSRRNLFGLGISGGGRARLNWPWPMYALGLIAPTLQGERQREILTRFDNTSYPYVPEQAMRAIRPLLFAEFETILFLGYPKLFLLPFDAGLRSELVMLRANRLAFTLSKGALVFSADMKAPPLRYLRASSSPSLGFQITQLNCWTRKLEGVDPSGRTCGSEDVANETRRLDNGLFGLGTLRFPIQLDGRDNIFRPHKGYLATAAADVVVGGGSLYSVGNPRGDLKRSTFVRLAAGITGYIPFTSYFTLAMALRGGTIIPLGPEPDADHPRDYDLYVPLFERFYLGGSDSVRGFQPDAVLVTGDESTSTGKRPVVSSGGNSFWNARMELRFPLIDPVEGGIFVDAGQLSHEWIDFRDVDYSAFSMGIGAGIRVNTPVGPLILDLALGLKDGKRDMDERNLYRVPVDDFPRRIVPHPALGYF